MITLAQLKQKLTDNEDYQTLVKHSVIPNDLRWEPHVEASSEYEEIDGKSAVTVTLKFKNYEQGPISSQVSRKINYPELMTEEKAYEQFPDDGWSADKQNKWEYNQLSELINKL